MSRRRRIAVLVKPSPRARRLAHDLAAAFARHRIDAIFDDVTAAVLGLGRGFDRSAIPPGRRILTVGGDGTLLLAARGARAGAEILGVNVGALGFLTSLTARQAQTMAAHLASDEFERDPRRLLEVHFPDGGSPARRLVLNDAVLNRGALSRIARFELRLDGEVFSSLRADGLILSSPTGSTAYNLSAGGPLLHPAVRAFLVTPICPHGLTHRPLALPGDRRIQVVARAGSPEGVYLTLDGQEGFRLPDGAAVSVRLSDRTVTLLRAPGRDYFVTLSEKLNWGA